MKKTLPDILSPKQITDAGMAFVLIMLLLRCFIPANIFLILAIIFLVINMTRPGFLTPLARIWYSLVKVVGWGMSTVLLSVVYVALVIPVGLIRKLVTGDKLQLKGFKKGSVSVFKSVDHEFILSDIEKPY
jgi:uncharacterized paraquat-inducible protein A